MIDGIPMCQKHRDAAHVAAMRVNGNTTANGIPGVTKVEGADRDCRVCAGESGVTNPERAVWEVFA